ncbi:15273_t:CDS:1 [Gigaspora margarita]|uniref:15273_t:CDS:1 n=1 Tax=Gigaspora margarita TaxID=4874 RepID=A0ABN7UQU3_GIGMA|nr:15273_t:CDS:1 [Gigaspora margarita]
MVKLSKILAFLILIFHVHLTTTLPTHVLEERNLTMLVANRSGHDLKKKGHYYFDPLNLKKRTIIRRPADLPIQMALIGLAVSCEKLKTFLAFCLCCAFNNLDIVISDSSEQQVSWWDRFKVWWLWQNLSFRPSPLNHISIEAPNSIRGPSLRNIWREYKESEYYNSNMGSSSNSQLSIPYCPTSEAIPDFNSQVLTPCIPKTVDDIVRTLDPSTSETCRYDPPGPPTSQDPTSQASTSQASSCRDSKCPCRIPYSVQEARAHASAQRKRDRLLALNAPGFAEFLEVLTLVSVYDHNPRVQMNLWRDFNRVRERFTQLNDTKFYLEVIQQFAYNLDRDINQLANFGLADPDISSDENIESLILYCSWFKSNKKNDELK